MSTFELAASFGRSMRPGLYGEVSSLVVAELKRGEAPDIVDLQALKYAAYCSQLTVKDVGGDYARYHNTGEETASTEGR